MSNYRRLISYIYAYEGGIKGKNIGFAKIEVRGAQCRIHVSVKKIYVGSNDIGVYLLAPQTELLLGRIFIRGGAGEFRINVNNGNIEGSGCSMEECYGLTIHDVESTWQCYTTIWDDAVTQAAEMTLEDVTAEQVRRKAEKKEKETEESAIVQFPITEEIARELEKEELQDNAVLPDEQLIPEEQPVPEPEPVSQTPPVSEPEPVSQTPSVSEPEPVSQTPPVSEPEPVSQTPPVSEPEPVSQMPPVPDPTPVPQASAAPAPFGPEDPATLQELDRLEKEGKAENRLWNQLQRRYAKVLAFNYEKGCEILTIKPQDIGLLPREIWVYGNNSFLLHGYYNYRHLILAKLNNPEGAPRYLLGVPGHYYSNEKYMASMFGFPHFVLARKQPEEDGRFGYWYTEIRL